MKKISSQNEINDLIKNINWEEAFLREWYLISPSYCLDDQSIVASNAVPSMKILICTPELVCPGIELTFEDVENVFFASQIDLNPLAVFQKDCISFSFNGDRYPYIIAKSLYYKFLTTDCWGWKTRYGMENLYDESGFLTHD